MEDGEDTNHTSSEDDPDAGLSKQLDNTETRFSKIKDKHDIVPSSKQDRRSFNVENIERVIYLPDEQSIEYSDMKENIQEALTPLEHDSRLTRLTGRSESLEEYLDNPRNNPQGEIVYSTEESGHPLGAKLVFKSQYSEYLMDEYDTMIDGAIIFRSEESAIQSWSELENKPEFLEYDLDDPDDAIGVSIQLSTYSPQLVSELDRVFDSLISISS